MKEPPYIMHGGGGRPKNYRAMVEAACEALHQTERAKKLMHYYASCGDGFQPSL